MAGELKPCPGGAQGMTRHRCPYCRCGSSSPRDDVAKWANDGFKAEGDGWFCKKRCQTCPTADEPYRCPRDPFCKRYLSEGARDV